MASVRAQALDAWWDFVEDEYREAEEATNGWFLRSDRRAEFVSAFGAAAVKRVMFGGGPAHVAFYFASEELLRWWAIHPRTTWAEFAWSAGVRDRTTRRAVEVAASSKLSASQRAWESMGARR